mmetsp:Transcript_4536/g.9387  ORF Transcript_4536/g.9387 Transcript_4536/m.9387 type:complete len:211 (-) Transcript_4536:935-1567(-)
MVKRKVKYSRILPIDEEDPDEEEKRVPEEGYGIVTYADGGTYGGSWEDSDHSGYGVYQWADAGRYEGQWKDGEEDGFGVYIEKSGKCYAGQWKAGEMDGVGFDFEDDGSHDILDEEDVVQLEPLLKTGKMCLKEEGEMPLGIIHFCKRFRVGASQKIVVAEEAILAQVPFAKSCSIPFPSKLHTGKSQRSIAQSCWAKVRKELRNVVLFC